MHVRAGHHDDLPAVARLMARSQQLDGTYPAPHYAGDSATTVARWLTRHEALARWVAVDDGEVVGHVQLSAVHDPGLAAVLDGQGGADGHLEVGRLVVAAGTRRRGTGAGLLDAAVAGARARGARPCLCVLATQHAAVALYRAAGFEELGLYEDLPSGLVLHAFRL